MVLLWKCEIAFPKLHCIEDKCSKRNLKMLHKRRVSLSNIPEIWLLYVEDPLWKSHSVGIEKMFQNQSYVVTLYSSQYLLYFHILFYLSIKKFQFTNITVFNNDQHKPVIVLPQKRNTKKFLLKNCFTNSI